MSVLSTARTAGAQTHKMFVTGEAGTGDFRTWTTSDGLGGIEGANRICQNSAALAHLPHAADFQAWLSDSSTDAYCNIKGLTGHPPDCSSFALHNPGPWERFDHAPFARNLDALVAGEVITAPSLDEYGHELPLGTLAWTGTSNNGKLRDTGFFGPSVICRDQNTGLAWTSASISDTGSFGYPHDGPVQWTHDYSAGDWDFCSFAHHLYCFQNSTLGGPPFDPFDSDGAMVFVTSTTYDGHLGASPDAGGLTALAAGDAICQTRARAGSLPNPSTFHAWLSSSTQNALASLAYDGPLKRPDGVAIASSKADLTDGELASPLAETELLGYADTVVRTGTDESGLGEPGEECVDWQSNASSDFGWFGDSTTVTASWSSYSGDFCSIKMALYCISDRPILFWTNFEESGGLWRWSGTAP